MDLRYFIKQGGSDSRVNVSAPVVFYQIVDRRSVEKGVGLFVQICVRVLPIGMTFCGHRAIFVSNQGSPRHLSHTIRALIMREVNRLFRRVERLKRALFDASSFDRVKRETCRIIRRIRVAILADRVRVSNLHVGAVRVRTRAIM